MALVLALLGEGKLRPREETDPLHVPGCQWAADLADPCPPPASRPWGGKFEWGGVKVSLGGSNWEGGAAPISCSVPTRGPHGSSA